MKFNVLKFDGETVTFSFTREVAGDAPEAVSLPSKNAPTPEFKKAFVAFRRHVLDCAPFLAEARKDIECHTIHLKRDAKNGRRSLQVSVNIPLEACQNKTITFTTPFMTEPADASGDPSGFLGANVLKMMDEIEDRAERHLGGEHRGQVEAFADVDASAKSNGKHHSENGTNGKKPHASGRGGSPSRVGDVLASIEGSGSKRSRKDIDD